MTSVSAFDDDALGELDAVGVAEALRSGAMSPTDAVEAAIARTQKVDPQLNGMAYEAFDRARDRAAATHRYGGYFDGVPTFIKDNVAVAGMPTMQGTDAWKPRPQAANGDFARVFLATGLVAARQDADVGVRLQRIGRTSADRARPQPVGPRLHGRGVVVGFGGVRRGGSGADRACQRRRRLDPHPGGLRRAGRSEADTRQAAAWTRTSPEMPLLLRRQRRGDPFGA